jgi:hypothetical protein
MVLMLALPVNINCFLQNCGAKPKPTTGQRKTEIFFEQNHFLTEEKYISGCIDTHYLMSEIFFRILNLVTSHCATIWTTTKLNL